MSLSGASGVNIVSATNSSVANGVNIYAATLTADHGNDGSPVNQASIIGQSDPNTPAELDRLVRYDDESVVHEAWIRQRYDGGFAASYAPGRAAAVRTAWHEAGHAVAALELGARFSSQQGGKMLARTPHQPQILWRKPAGYAASHCMQCKAGWTRTGPEQSVLTVCLLDREPVLTDMTDCNKFEPTQEPPADQAGTASSTATPSAQTGASSTSSGMNVAVDGASIDDGTVIAEFRGHSRVIAGTWLPTPGTGTEMK